LEHIVHDKPWANCCSVFGKTMGGLLFSSKPATRTCVLHCTTQWISWGYETMLKYELRCMI
jgi:hypothetical protein